MSRPTEWLVQEWPFSQALGERWIAFPLVSDPDKKWPGLRFFPSCPERGQLDD